jgi:hypothetical protein
MSRDQGLSEMQDAVKSALRMYWALFLFQGVVVIILGGIAIALPLPSTVAISGICRRCHGGRGSQFCALSHASGHLSLAQ